ncbi:MAG TPA: PIN domain-containing protein [Acidimicrobiales bacterium]|nr:PIN domain-containing protein [Acidimicrobiales bacterium]
MTLVDTAWVEFLRATGSATHRAVRRLLLDDQPAHTTDVVVTEVLAGARNDDHRDRLRRLLARCEHVPVEGLDDFETAADLYRVCRAGGEPVRALTDCLIAVVACGSPCRSCTPTATSTCSPATPPYRPREADRDRAGTILATHDQASGLSS